MMKLTLAVGRPPDVQVELATLEAARRLRLATPERIRREVSEVMGREVSWNTVAKYLERAVRNGKLQKRVLSQQERCMVAYYAPESES